MSDAEAIYVASVEFMDGSKPQKMRGYQDVKFSDPGVVHFVWDDEFLSIPLHRVKSISQTEEPTS